MNRRRRRRGRLFSWLPFIVSAAIVVATFAMRAWRNCSLREPPELPADPSLVLVTAYCNCGRCCGWRRNLFGFGEPVYNYGKLKGKPKKIGITASGSMAKHGTIAADPKVFPFGTHLDVPGYGVGTVEDIGGSIAGRHIDVWMPTHGQAKAWGRRVLKVSTVK